MQNMRVKQARRRIDQSRKALKSAWVKGLDVTAVRALEATIGQEEKYLRSVGLGEKAKPVDTDEKVGPQ